MCLYLYPPHFKGILGDEYAYKLGLSGNWGIIFQFLRFWNKIKYLFMLRQCFGSKLGLKLCGVMAQDAASGDMLLGYEVRSEQRYFTSVALRFLTWNGNQDPTLKVVWGLKVMKYKKPLAQCLYIVRTQKMLEISIILKYFKRDF